MRRDGANGDEMDGEELDVEFGALLVVVDDEDGSKAGRRRLHSSVCPNQQTLPIVAY